LIDINQDGYEESKDAQGIKSEEKMDLQLQGSSELRVSDYSISARGSNEMGSMLASLKNLYYDNQKI